LKLVKEMQGAKTKNNREKKDKEVGVALFLFVSFRGCSVAQTLGSYL
jgi:hypothetical protein